MQKHRSYFAIFLIIISAVGLLAIAPAFGSTTWNQLLTTNTDLESGLLAHWTFDGKNMNSRATLEALNRAPGGVNGDVVVTAATDVSYQSTSNSLNQGATTPYSWTHNHSGGNLLAVGVNIVHATVEVSSITYNSVPLQRAIRQTGNGGSSEIWYLLKPSSGSNTITVTLSGAPTDSAAGAVSLVAVSEIDPVNASAGATGNSAAPSVSLTTTIPGTVVFDSLASGDNGLVAPSGSNVERWDIDMGANVSAGSTLVVAGEGAQTMGWTTTADAWDITAVAFAPDRDYQATSTPGKIGQALYFGQSAYVDIGDALPNTTDTIKTISFWVQATSTASKKVIDIDGTDQIEIDSSNQITGTSFPGSVTYYVDGVAGSRVINNNQWKHVVITDTTGVNPSNMDIGRVGASYFNGKIDDVRMYNRVLSASEITRLYHLGATTRVNKTLTSNTDLKNGLVLHWPLDGASTNWSLTAAEVRDVSGNGRHGATTPAITKNQVVAGKIGQGFVFSGTDAYIYYETYAALPTTDFTYAFWVKPDQVSDTFFDASSVASDDEFRVDVNSSGQIDVYTNNSLLFTTTRILTLGKWYHVVVERSGSTVSVYIDGVADVTTGSDATAFVFGCVLYVGENISSITSCDDAVVTNTGLNGTLDDFRIYNRALSQTEITRLYHLGATTYVNKTLRTNTDLESGLTHYYSFDGKYMNWSAANEILDSSGNGRDANIQSGTKDAVASGAIGQGYDYTVANDETAVPNTNIPTGDFTYSLWTKPDVLSTDTIVMSSTLSAGGYEISMTVDRPANVLTVLLDSATTFSTARTLKDNAWNHIIVKRSGSTISAYINGVLDANTATDADTLSFNCDLDIGGGAVGSAGNCDFATLASYKGGIDDFRIYNRALSDSEALRLYQLGAK